MTFQTSSDSTSTESFDKLSTLRPRFLSMATDDGGTIKSGKFFRQIIQLMIPVQPT
ncbi:hypothetical protein [Anabaenopsis tanganyikae]|uniref:hypothetical protein n=1 Tax=Anabaenopsis tanganyikae TaxID=2785302 RepID=UPI003CC8AF3F